MQSQFDRQNVLVVGGAGFIGSNLCEYLLEKYNVICVDNYSGGSETEIDHLLSHDHFEFVRHDITQPLDFAAIKGAERFRVSFIGVKHVIFSASLSSPDVALAHPIDYLMLNAGGVRNALDAALASRARFIYLSDPAVLECGDADGNARQAGWSLLAEGKRFGERLVMEYRALYSLDVSIARMYPVYGANAHPYDLHFVPWLIRTALAMDEISLPAAFLSKKMSLLYVRDAVDAIEKLMTAETSGTFDIGSPTEHSVGEVVQHVLAGIGKKVAIREGTPADIPSQVFEMWERACAIPTIHHIKDATGWFPVVLLDAGVAKTIDYYKALRGMRRVGN